jgi:rod shape-determining protein MreD
MAGIINRVIMFVVLLLVQVLILNRVWLFNVATPLLYVYFVVSFPRNSAKGEVLAWSFALGLMVDLFSNTSGMASGTMTLVALLQPYLLELYVPRDSAENLEVTSATLGRSKFLTFSTILTLLYCLVFFILEAFNFFEWQLWLLRAVCSTVLTMVLMLAIDSVRSK